MEQHDLSLLRILTDRGTEYGGVRERHEFQPYLSLAIEDIDHTKIKAKSTQTNGICERFNRRIKDHTLLSTNKRKEEALEIGKVLNESNIQFKKVYHFCKHPNMANT